MMKWVEATFAGHKPNIDRVGMAYMLQGEADPDQYNILLKTPPKGKDWYYVGPHVIAGLTHGAFYGHFSSKDQLIAEACANALSISRDDWNNAAAKHPRNPLATIVASYLSTKHRDDLANGCLFAALGPDTVRQDQSVRRAFTDGLRAQIAILTKIADGASERARSEKAIAAMAGLVGALMLARAVDDPSLSDEILNAALATLGGKSGATDPAIQTRLRGTNHKKIKDRQTVTPSPRN